MLLYRWLTEATNTRGTAKALVYRDTYLSWRGLQHRVERRAQEFAAMGIERGDNVLRWPFSTLSAKRCSTSSECSVS